MTSPIIGLSSQVTANNIPFVTNPNGWDAGLRGAIVAQKNSPQGIAFLGDSTMVGLNVTNWQTKAWPMLMRNYLLSAKAGIALAGDYWPIALSSIVQVLPGPAMPWAVAANAGSQSWGTGFCINFSQANFTNPGVTFTSANTPTGAITAIELLAMDLANTGGTLTCSMDGSGAYTINAPGLYHLSKQSPWGALAAGSHVLRWTAQSTDNAQYICGVNCWVQQNSGFFFEHHAWGGQSSWDNFSQQFAHFPHDRTLNFQGPTGQNDNTIGFGFPFQPAVLFIQLGINDLQRGLSAKTSKMGLSKICQSARRGNLNCSIVFIINTNPSSTNSDTNPADLFTNSNYWRDYVEMLYELGNEFTALIVDAESGWSNQSVTLGYTSSTNAHPTDSGNAWIESKIEAAIGKI